MATAVVQHPELFAAALLQVGVYDMLRAELMPLGASNATEFGSVKTTEGFQALFQTSAYHHAKEGTLYPAILLMTGVNDPNVSPWQSAKMAARLQAATASGRPILLRADPDVGHGPGSPRSKLIAERVDALAFLWAELQPSRVSD
jgi:prolyl oligopeptidase